MDTKSIHIRWTTSKGRDTYGYNICTILVDGVNKASCNGGGYDMIGTCFGSWIGKDYQDRLLKLLRNEIKYFLHGNGGFAKTQYKWTSVDKYYGATIHYDPDTKLVSVILDGACGKSSIDRIAEAIGIKFKWNPESNRSMNHSYYIATITKRFYK